MKDLDPTHCRFLAQYFDDDEVTRGNLYDDYSLNFYVKDNCIFTIEYFIESTGLGIIQHSYHWKLNEEELIELLPKVIPYLFKRRLIMEDLYKFLNFEGSQKKTLYKRLIKSL